jgi:hypothetical protein
MDWIGFAIQKSHKGKKTRSKIHFIFFNPSQNPTPFSLYFKSCPILLSNSNLLSSDKKKKRTEERNVYQNKYCNSFMSFHVVFVFCEKKLFSKLLS